jgi:hypothetical protein
VPLNTRIPRSARRLNLLLPRARRPFEASEFSHAVYTIVLRRGADNRLASRLLDQNKRLRAGEHELHDRIRYLE